MADSIFARVASALGFERGAKPKANARVVPELSLWLQFQRIGGSLTPQQVSEILRTADSGYMWRLMDLANDSRQKDCHLHAVLAQSEESIAALDWELVLPEQSKARDKRAAKWVEDTLKGHHALPKQIGHMAGAVYYGYAVSEIIWGKIDGKIAPSHFDRIAPRRFGYRQWDAKFVWRDLNAGMPITGIDLDDYPDKFILSRPRVTGDVPVREGLVRVLVWASLFRNWTITDWLRTGEIAWKPWRIGKYEKGSSQEDVDGLVAVLDGLTTNGVAALPKTVEYDVHWAPGQGTKSSHAELFNVVAQEMSKAVLGQTETVQASTSSGYAQAKVHESVKSDLLIARARCIAAELTRYLIDPMVRLNFGPDVAIPQFRFITREPADLTAFSAALLNMTKAGVKIPQAWAREEAGIPEPKEDEELLDGGAEDPEANPEIPITVEQPKDEDGNPAPEPESPKEPGPKG